MRMVPTLIRTVLDPKIYKNMIMVSLTEEKYN